MSVEQLKGIKEQSDAEVNLLQDSLNNIRTATNRLDLASTALQDLSLRPQGKKMLVPLTASLYVPATLDDSHKVLVDVGTGYFIEVSYSLSISFLFLGLQFPFHHFISSYDFFHQINLLSICICICLSIENNGGREGLL